MAFFHLEMATVLGGIAWMDYTRLKIPNELLFILAVVEITFWSLGFVSIGWMDGAFAFALFVLSFVAWLTRRMGAGDVKLLTVVTLAIGLRAGLVFAVTLLGLALLTAGSYRWINTVNFIAYRWPLLSRLAELAEIRQVPYGVLIAIAAIVAVWSHSTGIQ